jgi:uncharacterized protein (DUF885 family)
LMYHEGSPGHHFQLSASQLIENVPFLRKVRPFSAYSEGWALYSERIAAEDMSMYDDYPLGNLGRLQAEMFRAMAEEQLGEKFDIREFHEMILLNGLCLWRFWRSRLGLGLKSNNDSSYR